MIIQKVIDKLLSSKSFPQEDLQIKQKFVVYEAIIQKVGVVNANSRIYEKFDIEDQKATSCIIINNIEDELKELSKKIDLNKIK